MIELTTVCFLLFLKSFHADPVSQSFSPKIYMNKCMAIILSKQR